MRREKLEIYFRVLSLIDSDGPIGITHISQKVNVNALLLKRILESWEKQRAIESVKTGKRIVYRITGEGMKTMQSACDLDFSNHWEEKVIERFAQTHKP